MLHARGDLNSAVSLIKFTSFWNDARQCRYLS